MQAWCPENRDSPPYRRGFTLVEMLIVVAIIAALMAVALRVLQPIGQRRVREAAREVNVYLSSARNRAMELGRPCGVIFKRANGTNFPAASMVLEQYVVPPLYAGDTTSAVVRVQVQSVSSSGIITLRMRIRPNDFSNGLIYPGDQIQLNNQGPYYTILPPPTSPFPPNNPPDFPPDPNNNGYFKYSNLNPAETDSDNDGFIDNYCIYIQSQPIQSVPWPAQASGQWSEPVSFQILRSFDKTPVSSLQLPAGAVVDLDFSGPDVYWFPHPTTPPNYYPNYDVGIVFSSNGGVEGMHCYRYNSNTNLYEYGAWRTAWPIFLSIGSSSRVRDFFNQPLPAAPNLDELPNWADLGSMWITINHLTGLVATSENCAVNLNDPNLKWNDITTWWPFVNQSRTYAWQSQSMGGR